MYSPVVWVTFETDSLVRTGAFTLFVFNKKAGEIQGLNGDEYDICLISGLTDSEGRALIKVLNGAVRFYVECSQEQYSYPCNGSFVIDINHELKIIRKREKK